MPSALKIIFFISIPIAILAIFFLSFYPRIIKRKINTDFLGYVGKKIYRIAELKDYFLLNKLIIPLEDKDTKLHIDHILFGNKYIYVISDRYIEGAMQAKENDEKWINFRSLNERPNYFSNPLKKNMERLEKLSLLSRIDKEFLISVVICNDDLAYDDFLVKNPKQYFVKIKDFKRLITTLESDTKVGDLPEKQLQELVKEISNLNKSEVYRINKKNFDDMK